MKQAKEWLHAFFIFKNKMKIKRLLLLLLFVLLYGIRAVAWTSSRYATIDGIRYWVIIGYSGDRSHAEVFEGEKCSDDIIIPSSITVNTDGTTRKIFVK